MTTSVTVLTCTSEHDCEVQSWGTKPAFCPFAPCSQPFLTPAQLAARTRAARKVVQVPSISANHPSIRALDAGARWAEDGALVR